MAEQQLIAILGADVSQFQKAMKNVQGSMSNTANQLNGSMTGTEGKVKKSTGSMGESFKKLGAIMATALAVDKLIDFGKFAVKASAEAEALNAQFEQVFSELGGQAQEAIEGMGKEFGMLPNRIKPAMTSMTSMFKGLGLDTDEAMKTAGDAVTLVADAAAFYDKSFEDANSALNSFIKGNYEGGEAIGLFANETQMASWASKELGIDWKNLDEAGKQITRLEYAKAMQEASGAMGQASRESEGYENVLGNLRQAWTDFSAVLAKPVLPIVIDSMQGLIAVLQSATGWVENLSSSFDGIETIRQIQLDFMGGNFDQIGELVPQMVEKFLSQGGSLLGVGANFINKIAEGMGMSVPELFSACVETAGALVEGFISSLPLILGTGVKIVEGLINGIVSALPNVISSISSIMTSTIETIISILPQILNLGMQLLTSLVQGIIQALPLLIEGIGQLLLNLVMIFTENLPLLMETGMSLLQAIITGILDNLELLITTITTVLTTMVTYITENLPMILQMGIELLLSLVQGILDSLPQMTNTILDLVFLISATLLQNIPLIIDAGIEILLAVIHGIIDMLPQLTTTAIELIFAISQALLDNLPTIIQAGVEILVAVIDGILKTMGEMDGAVDDIISAIFKGFKDVDWLSIGKNIISGITKGIKTNVSTVLGAIGGVASSVLKAGKKALEIGSPSKLFEEEVGKMIPQGIAVGVSEETDLATRAVNDMSDSLVSNTRLGQLNKIPKMDSDSGFGQAGNGEITINVPLEIDGREIARAIATFINEEMDKIQMKNNRLMGQYS